MPIFDFFCTTVECPERTEFHEGEPNKTIELLVKVDEEPECEVCGSKLNKVMPAPKGYVKGTNTPVRYRKRIKEQEITK